MKLDTLREAITECQRLERTMFALLRQYENGQKSALDFNLPEGRNAAAVKRASMDMTRKLADLRQGR